MSEKKETLRAVLNAQYSLLSSLWKYNSKHETHIKISKLMDEKLAKLKELGDAPKKPKNAKKEINHLKAIYNLTTKILIITGNDIQTYIERQDEMGEWGCVSDLKGNPLFDIQLDFDEGIDADNIKCYSLQYVKLVKNKETGYLESDGNYKLAELTIIVDEPYSQVLGVAHEALDGVRSHKEDNK